MSSRAPTARPSRSRCSRRRTEGSPSRGRAVHRHVMTTRLITFAVTLGLALVASVLTATTALGQPQAPLTRCAVTAAAEESPAAATWFDLPAAVTVAAGESEVAPFTVTVPDQAEPGDHPAGVAASVVSRQSAEDGTAVGVESRMGVKVITRVT